MNNRIEFHEELSKAPGLAEAKTLNGKAVYFQPPSSVRMIFPCIIYDWDRARDFKANNYNYIFRKGYRVTVVDPNPDSEIPDWIMRNFRYASMDRPYVADNLHHFPITIYY